MRNRSCFQNVASIIALILFAVQPAFGDELAYRYEGDVLPYPDAGFHWGGCVSPCSESIENGHLVNRWSACCQYTAYDRTYALPPETAPPVPFWMEWRFRTNQHFAVFGGLGGEVAIYHQHTFELMYMYADAAVSESGDAVVTGLTPGEFRTYRFEKPDDGHFCFFIDGKLFYCLADFETSASSYFQLNGDGGPHALSFPPANEWDYVRLGHMTTGEALIASDPPGGDVDIAQYPNLTSFTITFDQPNYVHVDEVSVQVSAAASQSEPQAPARGGVFETRANKPPVVPLGKGNGSALAPGKGDRPSLALRVPIVPNTVTPQVIKTRRQDNGAPETVEIVLDRPLQLGVTTTFTFATGGSPNTVTYTLVQTGACCQADGTCTQSTNSDCAALNGSFSAGDSCSTPTACCIAGGACRNLAEACCSLASGTSNSSAICEGDADHDGIDGMCGDTCPNDPQNDVDGDGLCGDVDPCPNLNPNDANHNGIPDCQEPTPIPATSQWGLVIIAIAILVIARTYSLRRA